MKNFETRLIGLITIASGLIYLNWLITAYNASHPVFSGIFMLVALFGFISSIFLVVNNWSWDIPAEKRLGRKKPKVAVIVPTWNEPVAMVFNTLESILKQNYPTSQLTLILSDDGNDPQMQSMLFSLKNRYKAAELIYNIPPSKDSVDRVGEGKAGNLNSALMLVQNRRDVQYIETRDADDLVGDPDFLQKTLAQLEDNEKLAFVQTIKDVQTPDRDPFGNKEVLFYKSLMLSKNSAGAVFPCGSGLVWRKEAILDIGGFPTWNIVEDFQSGIDALRKGWKSMYIPIVGAIGQVAPEDIPNLYKQRGTWALDSLRFFFWGNKKGLSFRQWLHFMEPGFFYIACTVFYFQAFIPVISLYADVYPVDAHPFTYFIHIMPHILSAYLLVLSLIRRQGIRFKEIVRSFQTWFGLGPVYFSALLLAIFGGPNGKPKYKVTRKTHKFGIFFLQVLPQIMIITVTILGIVYQITNTPELLQIDYVTISWGIFYIFTLQRIVRNSWFTFRPIKYFLSIVSPNLSGSQN